MIGVHNLGEVYRDNVSGNLGTEFEHYVKIRGRSLADAHAGKHEGLGLDLVQSNYDLLEDAGSHFEEVPSEPDTTICMPIAILHEDRETLERSLGAICSAQEKSGQSIELILWANAAEDYEPETYEVGDTGYENLRILAGTVTGPDLRIRTALQYLPPAGAAMSNIRANLMDAVVLDGINRGFAFEHPVLWLDADTTFVASEGLGLLIDEVQSMDALFAHANLQYSIDWANGRKLHELDDVTRAIAVHEIIKRQDARAGGEMVPYGYVEESGLAFSLGVYVSADGVGTDMPMNESYTLMERAKYRFLRSTADPDCIPSVGPNGQQAIIRIPEARVGVSARRFNAVVRQLGLRALYDRGSHYDDGTGLFTHISPTLLNEDCTIKRPEMDALLGIERSSHTAVKDTELINSWEKYWLHRNKVARRLIDKYFEE